VRHLRAVTRITTEQEAFERVVMHAFELLPVFRKVFLLCDIEGFSVAETAEILGISPAAVVLRLDRARREVNLRRQTRPMRRNTVQ
jgi:DNA-directed RNA polymerase specialized sigma24 family protein